MLTAALDHDLRDAHEHSTLTRLLEELHLVFELLVTHSVDPGIAIDEIRNFMALFQRELAAHIRYEEQSLFPQAAAALDDTDALDPILAQHRQIEQAVVALAALVDAIDDEDGLDAERRARLLHQVATVGLLFTVHDRAEHGLFEGLATDP